MRHHTLALAILCACLAIAACSDNKTAPLSQQAGEESLPQPDATGGSVTGMPNPGTPSVLPPPADTMATDAEDVGIGTETDVENVDAIDPNLPAAPPTITIDGVFGKPPADSMPVMPAHPPLPAEPTDQSQIVMPPES